MILSWLKKKDIDVALLLPMIAGVVIFWLFFSMLGVSLAAEELMSISKGTGFLIGAGVSLFALCFIWLVTVGDDGDSYGYFVISFILLLLLNGLLAIFIFNIEVPVLPWIAVGVIAFILMELLYWIDDEVPGKKKSKFWFSVYKKFDALADVLLIFLVAEAIALAWTYIKWEWVLWLLNTILGVLIQVAVAMIVTAAIIAALYGYIKLNQLKYGKDEKPKKKKKGRGKK